MSLVTTKQMLLDAQKGHYAIGAFNVENMEMVMAVVAAAEELNSPVIMQTTPSTVKYAGLDYFFANAKVAAQNAKVQLQFIWITETVLIWQCRHYVQGILQL